MHFILDDQQASEPIENSPKHVQLEWVQILSPCHYGRAGDVKVVVIGARECVKRCGHQDSRPSLSGSDLSSQPSRRTVPLHLPRVSTMEAKSQRPKDRGGVISTLNRSHESLKGDLKYHASSSCLWCFRHSSCNVQGLLPPLSPQSTQSSHIPGTQ